LIGKYLFSFCDYSKVKNSTLFEMEASDILWKGRIGVACYGLLIVIQAAIFKEILFHTNLSVFQLLLLRASAQTILVLPSISKSNIQFMSKYGRWTDLNVWTIIHTTWVVALHAILEFGLIGSAMSLLALGQFGSIILARIFLQEELKYIHLPMFVMCFSGMLLILQPPLIFGGDVVFSTEEAIWMYSFLIVISIGFTWVRKLQGIPLPMTLGSEAVALVVSNLIIELSLGWNRLDFTAVCLGLAFGVYALLANILFYYATPLIPVAETAFIRSLDKVWGYLLDFLVMAETLRWNAIIGSGIILMAMLLLACSKIEDKPEEGEPSEEVKVIYIQTDKQFDPTLPLKPKHPNIPIYIGPEQAQE